MKNWETPSIIKLDPNITKDDTCYCETGEQLVAQFKLSRSLYGGHSPHSTCKSKLHPLKKD